MTPPKKETPTRPRKDMGIDEIAVGRVFQAVDQITEATAKITSAISDRGGLMERAALLEETAKQLREEADAVKAFRQHTSDILDRIEKSVEAHHTDKGLHTFIGLVGKKDILTLILVIFLVLHSLIPPNVSAWELIRKVAGL